MYDERLKQAIKKTANQQYRDSKDIGDEFYMTLVKNNEKRARKILKDMRSTLSDFLLRYGSLWIVGSNLKKNMLCSFAKPALKYYNNT